MRQISFPLLFPPLLSETITLHQTTFSCVLQPYFGLEKKISTLSHTCYFSETLSLYHSLV